DFAGDGMMAVFGAPTLLPNREAAAVRAAREIGIALGTLAPPGAATPLAAGIGIASGPAFVGNVRSADRLFWTALGNTTNLAARPGLEAPARGTRLGEVREHVGGAARDPSAEHRRGRIEHEPLALDVLARHVHDAEGEVVAEVDQRVGVKVGPARGDDEGAR